MVDFLHITTKMATYAPRTLLRLFNDDKTAHVTGVVLKDGTLFDVKTHVKYINVEEWKDRSGFTGELTVDASKAMGVVITDTHEFEYPSKNAYADWVFEILTELAPQLLTNEAVRNAHQKFIHACNKQQTSLRLHGSYFFQGECKYKTELLSDRSYTYRLLPFAYYTSYAYEKMNMEIVQKAYTELRNLIADDLLPPLKEKEEHYTKLAGKRIATRWIKMHERRIKKYEEKIKASQSWIEEYKKKL